jgi:GntR family transcriptional regulator / MocR family aminotransferase
VGKGFRGASQSLYQQLKAAILDGRLKAGTQLPPGRLSGDFFGVSRNTITEVYGRLVTDGLAIGRHGSGTYVTARIPATPRRRPPRLQYTHRLNPFWLRPEVTAALGFWREPAEREGQTRQSARADFRPAMIDSRLFPFDALRVVMAKHLRGRRRSRQVARAPRATRAIFICEKQSRGTSPSRAPWSATRRTLS